MRCVLLGEQATGKSSLLVALYGALVNRRAGDLRLVRTVDEVEFLSRGLQAFGRQESLQRTDVDSDAKLLVDVARGDEIVTLDLPDRSGELLKNMLDARIWEPVLRRQIGHAEGAMLFLRGDDVVAGETPEAGLELLGPGVEVYEPGRADDVPLPWTPVLMPPDVRTVDLLQAVLDERASALPVAIIISAYDSVSSPVSAWNQVISPVSDWNQVISPVSDRNQVISPVSDWNQVISPIADWNRVSSAALAPPAWLAQHMPLLDQFLDSNSDRLPHAVFGVSAQGGDFSAGLASGLVDEDPWDRAYVVCPDDERRTLAEPVLWLLNAKR
jgi:hypothetical protein